MELELIGKRLLPGDAPGLAAQRQHVAAQFTRRRRAFGQKLARGLQADAAGTAEDQRVFSSKSCHGSFL